MIQHDSHGTCPNTNFDSLSFSFLEKGLFFSRQDGCVIVPKRWLYFKSPTKVDHIRDRNGTSSGTSSVTFTLPSADAWLLLIYGAWQAFERQMEWIVRNLLSENVSMYHIGCFKSGFQDSYCILCNIFQQLGGAHQWTHCKFPPTSVKAKEDWKVQKDTGTILTVPPLSRDQPRKFIRTNFTFVWWDRRDGILFPFTGDTPPPTVHRKNHPIYRWNSLSTFFQIYAKAFSIN